MKPIRVLSFWTFTLTMYRFATSSYGEKFLAAGTGLIVRHSAMACKHPETYLYLPESAHYNSCRCCSHFRRRTAGLSRDGAL